MRVKALKKLTFNTSKGIVTIEKGKIFKPADSELLIKAGLVEPVILPPDQAGRPIAAKIYSKILDATVWVVTHPDAICFIPKGEIYYLPEEIRNLRGASPEEVRQIYMMKILLNGRLVETKERKELEPLRRKGAIVE